MIVGLPVLTPASRWFRLLRIESRFAFSTAHLLCHTFHPRNGLRFIPNLDPNMRQQEPQYTSTFSGSMTASEGAQLLLQPP